MKALVLVFGLLISTSAWSFGLTADAMKQVQPGMSQSQVMSLVGQPDGFATREGHLVLTYNDCFVSGFSPDKTDFYIVLKDDKVVEKGMSEVRRHNAAATNGLLRWLNR